jgi:hypothetical protein
MTKQPAVGASLDRLISLYEKAYRLGEPDWRVDLSPPASDDALDRIETELGRLLPEEARQLYRWHDGCSPSIVPDLRFNRVKVALEMHLSLQYAATHGYRLPSVTNRPETLEPAALFPVFNIDKTMFNVVTASSRRASTSALYLLDAEFNALTKVAFTVGGFIEHLVEELQRGNVNYTAHGLRWNRDPYRFDPMMDPYGSEPTNQSQA